MTEHRTAVLLIAKDYRGSGDRQLATSFMSGLLSKLRHDEKVNPTVLSYDDHSGDERADCRFNDEWRVVRLPPSSIFGGLFSTGSRLEFWPGQANVPLGRDILSRSVTFAAIGQRIVKLLPTLRVVHWLEPIVPWKAALTYFLRSQGVKSYMTIFSLHKRYPAHYGALRITLAGLEKIVVTTAGLQQVLSEEVGVPAQKVTRIPLGVDLELHKPCIDKPSAKRRLGINPDHRVFSWFGPIEPCTPKDFLCVLNAAQYVHERFPASLFIFAFKNRTPPKARASGNWMRFYQNLHQIRDILDATDAVVLPFSRTSWQRGLPLTIVEALASGIPVITTERGGMGETITNGFNGLLVQEAEDVSQATLSLCEAEGKLGEMSRNARLAAERGFDISVTAQAYRNLWDA